MSRNPEIDLPNMDVVVRHLEGTPKVLRGLLLNLPDTLLHAREITEGWSPREVLVHFLHNERENWSPRLKVFLESGPENGSFVPFNQMPGPDSYTQESIAELLDTFEQERTASIQTLKQSNLGAEDFNRTATHPSLGKVRLGQMLSAWVVHDLNHIHQIVKTVAKEYRSAVGPWRELLALLDA